LATLAVVALQNAREKSRDAKRVSDIKQLQTALDLYFADMNAYPNAAGINLGTATYTALCGHVDGFMGDCGTDQVYMDRVPADPGTGAYTYTVVGGDQGSYQIAFTLEGPTGGLAADDYLATPAGIEPAAP
jgi:hypothetical protein